MNTQYISDISLRTLTITFAFLFLTVISSTSIALLTLTTGAIATTIAFTLAMISFIAIPLTWLAFRKLIYQPIQDIYSEIVAFQQSATDEEQAHQPSGSLEIKKIAEAFNKLKAMLKGQKEIQIQFLASVAHDLRNPLGAIQNAAELLADAKDADPDQKMLSEIIMRQARQLDRLVGDVLEASRIEAGRLELKKERVNLVEVIRDSVVLHDNVSPIHKLILTSTTPAIWGELDRDRIGQMINNLLSNAIKYSPGGGQIEVAVERKDSHALISVSDPGIGIEPSEVSQIFEPFHRTRLSTTTAIPGVGLGLSVTKKIIEAHNGKVWVESQPGVGSKFIMEIPLDLSDRK